VHRASRLDGREVDRAWRCVWISSEVSRKVDDSAVGDAWANRDDGSRFEPGNPFLGVDSSKHISISGLAVSWKRSNVYSHCMAPAKTSDERRLLTFVHKVTTTLGNETFHNEGVIIPSGLQSSVFAIAGVAHLRRLVLSMAALVEAEEVAGLGGLHRVVVDSSYTTLYLFFGGAAAFERVLRSDWYHNNADARRAREQADKIASDTGRDPASVERIGLKSPSWPPKRWASLLTSPTQPTNADRLATPQVRRLLLSALGDDWENVREWVDNAYPTFFGMESQMGIHGSLSSILFYTGHTVDGDACVRMVPMEPYPAPVRLYSAVRALLMCAWVVFRDNPGWDEIVRLSEKSERLAPSSPD
jgi:hypothetical protein